MWETWFDPWVGKIPWRREWLCTPVFWPGEFQGAGSLVACHLWDCTELDTTELLSAHMQGFTGGPVVKNPPCNARDTSSIPDPGRSHIPDKYIDAKILNKMLAK